MPVLASPSANTGPLTAADLEATRKHSTGTVRLVPAGCGQQRWPERRVNWPDTVPVQPYAAEACTEVGADAVESMWRYRRAVAAVKGGLALAALLFVAGHIVQRFWPLA